MPLERGYGRRPRRVGSIAIVLSLILGAILLAVPSNMPNARADWVDHRLGHLDLLGLTDWGSLGLPMLYLGVVQNTYYPLLSGRAHAGLIFDQADYNHSSLFGLADAFDSGYATTRMDYPDFNITVDDDPISFVVNNATLQKSYARFTKTDPYNGTGVPYDVRIHQTAWTFVDKDWAVIEWRFQNILGSDITDVNVAFGAELASPGYSGGPGGDGHDDVDYWDAANDLYYVVDDMGTGQALGFASALTSKPFNHYLSNETLDLMYDNRVYENLTGPSGIIGAPGGTRICTLLSWNGYSIPTDGYETFAFVIAAGIDVNMMKQAVQDAQDFYQIVAEDVVISEFQDSSSPSQKIEVYNAGGHPVDLSSWILRNRLGATITGTWIPNTSLGVGQHRYLDVTGIGLDPEGDVIRLYNETNVLKDSVGYGQYGIAPDPVTDESTVKIWDPSRLSYIDEWTMTIPGLSSTDFGTFNNVPQPNPDPPIVLNEVLYYNSAWERFVELRYTLNTTLDLTGYKIVGDSIFTVPSGTVTDSNPFHYITQSTPGAATLFSGLTTSGDNIYLYDNNGRLLDMVGWSSQHCMDESVRRVPEGNGTHDGYDDQSSMNAGWWFCQRAGLPLILFEPDQTVGADVNTTVFYNVTITNLKNDQDVVDLMFTTVITSGWSVTLYAGDGSWTPLTDTDSDTYLDIGVMKPGGLAQYESVNVSVKVTVPEDPPNNRELTGLGAQSDTSWTAFDVVYLTTDLTPYIRIDKYANPKTIWVEGDGNPDKSEVTLELIGRGMPQRVGKPHDIVMAIDSSSSMLDNDPDGYRIIGAKQYIDKLTDEDRVALVGFGNDYDYIPDTSYYGAWLTQDVIDNPFPRAPHHLRNATAANKPSMKDDAESLNWTYGQTNIEYALQVALAELIPSYTPGSRCRSGPNRAFPADLPGDADGSRGGSPYRWWAIVLLTDGLPSHDQTCTDSEVALAVAYNIKIFTIGIGNSFDPIYLERDISEPTGGKFIYAAEPEDIPEAYEQIRVIMTSIAGTSLPPPSPPFVRDYVPIGLNVDLASINPTPDFAGVDPLGNTLIFWELERIVIGDVWTATYNLSCSVSGTNLNVTKYPWANVNYLDWEKEEAVAIIPSDYVNCIEDPPPTIEVWEPGGTPGQVYVRGAIIDVTWFAEDDNPLPMNPINITYGLGPTWTTLSTNEANDGVYTWDTADVPCPATYWMRLSVYDSIGQTVYDYSNYSFDIICPLFQPFITNVVVEPGGVNVSWFEVVGADYYELYGGPTQISLNLDLADLLATVFAPRTWWFDINRFATDPYEYYYVVRAVDTNQTPDLRSLTSNTGGYYRIDFDVGLNTFSLPLEPFNPLPLDDLMNNMGASSISWQETNDDWVTYPSSPAPLAQVGKGYVVASPDSAYIFTGEPGAMIMYTEEYDWDFPQGSLVTAVVTGTDIELSWPALDSSIDYHIYRSTSRNGFFSLSYDFLGSVSGTTYTDFDAASSAGEYYYIVVPVNNTIQELGASTYSIGVVTSEYSGNEFFGLSLKPIWGLRSADWYVDQILYCQGITFLKDGLWIPHFKEFDEGVYDTYIEYGRGYEISVYQSSLYVFIGW